MKTLQNIGIGVGVILLILVTVFATNSFSSGMQANSFQEGKMQETVAVPLTLSQKLQEVYSQKLEFRLKKSDLLVQQAELLASTQKNKTDLVEVDQKIVKLNEEEISLSKSAVTSLQE